VSIKIKFSIFLAVLLLLTVGLLSIMVLNGIEMDQRTQYEQFLDQQARTANLYVMQSSLAEVTFTHEEYIKVKGKELAEQLGEISGQLVVLYDSNGDKVGESLARSENDDLKDIINYALNNKIAYQVSEDSLYYMAPLLASGQQVGVVQFYYSLSRNNEFYHNIKMLFIYIGVMLFMLSFTAGYFYFNTFATGILKLKKMTDKIKEGQYDVQVLSRKDELGSLSEGIFYMSKQIKQTIQEMITEQEKLKLAVQKLSQLEKQQKEFIGNVTHEFKTPLTSVKAYIDLLDMYPGDVELLEEAKLTIKLETERLYEMVEKVLQLSVLEKYDFEYNKERINIQEIILQVCSSLKGKMDKFDIKIETQLVEAFIDVDRESLVIILINLLDNAIKYNKSNGHIIIRSYISDSKVNVEIRDTGIGMPQDADNKIFQPFYTVDRNRSRENGGTGLGLSLVKKLMEAQQGSIQLVETSDEGSEFLLSFPRYKE